MAIRARRYLLSESYKVANSHFVTLKDYALAVKAKWAAQTIIRREALETSQQIRAYAAALQTLAAVPGIGAWAQQQEGDSEYEIGPEFTALVTAMNAASTGIEAAFPKDAAGTLLLSKLGAGGAIEDLTFTPQQITAAGIPALLQAVADAITIVD